MTHCEGFSLWNSRNAKLLIPRNLSWQEIKNMCLVDFTLIWSHRCDFPEIISSLKSILKEFLVPTLNLETRWCWSWINKCKRRLLSRYRHSSYNAVLLYRGIPSNAGFSKPKTALNFYLTRFFQNKEKKFAKNLQKKNFGVKFFFFNVFFLLLLIIWYTFKLINKL